MQIWNLKIFNFVNSRVDRINVCKNLFLNIQANLNAQEA